MYLGMCLQVKLENESRAGLYSMKKFYALLFSRFFYNNFRYS